MIGEVLGGRYRIVRPLARGGMGVVYEAEQIGLSRRVAVKLLNPEDTDPSWVKRFEAEARIVATLRHPNTLRVFDYGRTEDGTPYLVCELLKGEPVSALLRSGPMDPDTVLRLIRDVARALAEAHALGIVHRDIKPQNLVLERVEDEILFKVLDFGIAKHVDKDAFDTHAEPGVRTMPGTLVGTPAYLSPEQATGRPVVAASDLYSLGATAFHLLTGRVVFVGGALQQVIAHGSDATPSFAEVKGAPEIAPEVETFVLKLLAKNPAERPRSAAAVAEEADRLLAERTQKLSPNTPKGLKTTLTGVFTVAVLAGAAITALRLADRPLEPPHKASPVQRPGRTASPAAPLGPPSNAPDALHEVVDSGFEADASSEPPETFFGRTVEIVDTQGFVDPTAAHATVTPLFARIARCHADHDLEGPADIHFEVGVGLSISVSGDADATVVACLRARLDQTLIWPDREWSSAVVVVRITPQLGWMEP